MSFLNKFQSKINETREKLIAPDELQVSRIEICDSCEYLFKPIRQCKACGCIVDMKAKLISSKCPKNKW